MIKLAASVFALPVGVDPKPYALGLEEYMRFSKEVKRQNQLRRTEAEEASRMGDWDRAAERYVEILKHSILDEERTEAARQAAHAYRRVGDLYKSEFYRLFPHQTDHQLLESTLRLSGRLTDRGSPEKGLVQIGYALSSPLLEEESEVILDLRGWGEVKQESQRPIAPLFDSISQACKLMRQGQFRSARLWIERARGYIEDELKRKQGEPERE